MSGVESFCTVGMSRNFRLIRTVIRSLDLNLESLTVLTEAGTGPYALTPLIAAMAGASKVFSFARDTRYARAGDAIEGMLRLAHDAAVADTIVPLTQLSDCVDRADVVTNLAQLRPLDATFVARLKPTAAVPLMFETWEYREKDIDLGACWSRGIPVLGTNEEDHRIKILEYLGPLCVKKLMELGIEIVRSRLLVCGAGKFGPIVTRALVHAGADVVVVSDSPWGGDLAQVLQIGSLDQPLTNPRELIGLDAIIVATHVAWCKLVIGEDGPLRPSVLRQWCPDAPILQLAGEINRDHIRAAGIECFPEPPPAPGHMGWTLADLGPRPVVDLHAAGLKVGELLARARLQGLSLREAERAALQNPIAQDFPSDIKKRFGRVD